jgi:hypothetical protein
MSLSPSGIRWFCLAALVCLGSQALADSPQINLSLSPAEIQQNEFWETGFHRTGTDGPAFTFFNYQDQLIAGGAFQQAGEAISRYVAAWDGTRWSPLGIGMDAWVVCFAEYQGSLIAGGNFRIADGNTVNYIARWDGNTWVPLGGGMNGPVWALTVHEGKLVAGGLFSRAGDALAVNLATWDGTRWSALGKVTDQEVLALLSRPGELLVGGAFNYFDGHEAGHIVSWDGTSWHTLGGGTDGQIVSLAEFQGKVVAAGYFSKAGGNGAANIAVWDGTSWSSLGAGTNGGIDRLLVHEDRLLAAGSFTQAGGNAFSSVAAWDGSAWSAVGNPLNERGTAIAVYHDALMLSGQFQSGNTATGPYTLEFFAQLKDGIWQPVLEDRGRGTNGGVNAIAFYNGDLIVGGGFTVAGNVPARRIARWNGHAWEEMGGGFTDVVFALKVSKGTLYAGGLFGGTNTGTELNGIARWDGNAWQPMGFGFNRSVFDIEDYFGTIMVCGNMANTGGRPVNRVCYWDGDSWRSLGTGMTGTVKDLVTHNQSLYAAGAFTIPDIGAQYVAKWNTNHWEKIDHTFDAPVVALASYNGDLIAAGSFRGRGDEPIRMIARWDGAVWHSMGEGFNAPVNSLAIFKGRLIAAGQFEKSGDLSTHGVAAWDGTSWQTFGSGVDGPIPEVAYAIGNGDRMVVGGYFNRAGGRVANNLSAWSPYLPAVLHEINALRTVPGAVVSWDLDGLPGDSPEFDVYREEAGRPRILLTRHSLFGETHYIFTDGAPPRNGASYWIAELDRSGRIIWHGPAVLPGLPVALSLAQNAPNPFSADTRFAFETPLAGNVRLAIYDISGREVVQVFQGSLPAGPHETAWNGKDREGRTLAAGIYVARLSAPSGEKAKKILKIQ